MKRGLSGSLLAGFTLMSFAGSLMGSTNTWIDNFDGAAFDARWGEDEPNVGAGAVSLDTVNAAARFEAFSAINMWTARAGAPILWTASPSGNFLFETHVSMSTNQNFAQAGIVVYSADGAIPNFILALDHWNGAARVVKLQGIGDNNPNILAAATGGEAWLRLKVLRDAGAGGVDQYVCLYKLNLADPWATLATYNIDTDSARVGLTFKTNGGGKTAEFSYAMMTELPATFTDNFDDDVFDVRWGEDEPNPALGTVTLDTANDYAHFEAFGNIDMWTVRKDAPILWVPSPSGDFYVETHVMTDTAQSGSTAGIVVYGNNGSRPEFILQLNHWTAHIVHLQGLGGGAPDASVAATGGEAWLRLVLLRDGGVGGVDRYLAQYRLTVNAPWRLLGTHDEDVPNARAGLVFKANATGKSADFSYVTVGECVGFGDGDAVKVDFSQPGDGAGGSLVDWNQIIDTGGNLPVGSVVRHGDGAILDGVSIVLRNYISGNVDDNPNSNDWPGTGSDPYYIVAADDIYYHGNAPNDFAAAFIVDPTFAYNVRIYALIGDNPGSVEGFAVTDGAGKRTVQTTRGDRWSAATLEDAGMVFTGLTANASGEVVVTVEDVTSPFYPLNAIVLESVARAPIAPAVTSLGATNVLAASATLRGEVTTGFPLPDVTILWWASGGATNSADIGERWTVFETGLSGLLLGTEYGYCFLASNNLGVATSLTYTFTTASTGIVPVVTATVASRITTSTATVGGAVTAGDPPPIVSVHWGPRGALTNEVSMGVPSGSFSTELAGLTENTVYGYYCEASNLAGVGVSTTNFFTTDASASIAYAGVVEGEEARAWRTATTPKTMDIDHDNIYGSTLGAVHWVRGTAGQVAVGAATHGWAFVRSGNQYNLAGYASIDYLGVPGSNTTAGISVSDFTLELAGTVTDYADRTVRVGIMHDVLAPNEWAGDTFKALRVTQTIGGDGDSGIIPLRSGSVGDDWVEMYFFDITGIRPGDQFTITGLRNVGGVSGSAGYIGPVSLDIVDNSDLSPGTVLIVR